MDVNMSEREQLGAIRDWWKRYGNFTIIVFIIALAGNIGWNFYKKRHESHSEYASMLYTRMLTSYALSNTKAMKTQADYLVKNFPHVPYASLANFTLVKQLVNDGKLSDALTKLNDVIEREHSTRLVQIARIRKARILLAQEKTKDAINTLNTIDEKSFMPLINEVRGDIYVAQGELVKARTEYQAALKALPMGEVNRSLLQMKFDQISGPDNGFV